MTEHRGRIDPYGGPNDEIDWDTRPRAEYLALLREDERLRRMLARHVAVGYGEPQSGEAAESTPDRDANGGTGPPDDGALAEGEEPK